MLNQEQSGSPKALQRAVLLALLASPVSLFAPGVSAQSTHNGLDEIIVTSSRIPTPIREVGTAVSVISGEDIELQGYQSIADVLRTQPGIAVSNSGGAGKATSLRIRGEESYRTMVMIDGVKVSDPTGTQVGPNFDHLLSTGDLERIEILRGPQGFIYGADAGGIVNMLTRTGEGDFGGRVGLEFGDFGTQKFDANVSGGSESGDYFLSVSDVDSDGFNSRTEDTILADDDGYENTTVHTKFGWNPAEEVRVQLVVRDIDARTEFDRCGFPSGHNCFAETEQTTFRLSADYSTGDLTHAFAYGNTDVVRSNFSAGVNSFATEGDLTRLEYTGSYELNSASTFVYGLDFQEEDIISSAGDNLKRDQDAFYFEYQGQFSDKLFFTVGARRDDNDDFGEHTSERVTLAYIQDLSDGSVIKYRASFGSGFRAPSLSEIAYNNGPFAFAPAKLATLSEETSEGYDVGIEYTAASGLSLEATYFDQDIEDEIFFDLSGFSGYLQSLGISQSTGVEFAFQYPFSDRWEMLGNVTYNDTEDTEGLQRIRRPEKLGNIGLRFSSADDKFRFNANYRLSSDSVDELFGIGRLPLDDYEVLDLSASFVIDDRFEVYGRIENVTDKDYQEVTGFFSGGSSASAGVRLRF